MKTKMVLFVLLLGAVALGQTATPAPTVLPPLNIWGVGLSWNQGASSALSQQFAGTAFYAREQNTAGTYLYTMFDVVSTTVKPLTVTTNTGIGLGQKITTVAGWTIYATATAGPSWTGSNAGWNWTGGGMAAHAIGKSKWNIIPMIRTVKSSVNNNSGYQLIFSLGFGTGN
jgi:hypothetical protein